MQHIIAAFILYYNLSLLKQKKWKTCTQHHLYHQGNWLAQGIIKTDRPHTVSFSK